MRKLLSACCAAALFLMLPGCTTRYYSQDPVPPVAAKLDRDQVLYVAVPKDGAYGDRVYTGSGQQTATALQTALRQYASVVLASEQYEDAQTAMEQAKVKSARYVFVPVVTSWIHRRAAWSGRSSGVALTVAVYDLAREGDDKRIMQRDLRVRGRNLTLISQYPGEILKPLLERFAREIF